MRLLIKFFILISVIATIAWFSLWLESYFHKVYPCSLKNVRFKDCFSANRDGGKDCYGDIHISLTGFCENYEIDSEEFFLQKIDSALLSVVKTMDRNKYNYFYFEILDDCPINCDKDLFLYPHKETGTFHSDMLNELECEDKYIIHGAFFLKNKGRYGFYNHRLKSKSKLNAGKLENYKFTRKINLEEAFRLQN